MEDVELLVDLQKLEGATSSPPLLLRLAVVDVLNNRRQASAITHTAMEKKQRSKAAAAGGRWGARGSSVRTLLSLEALPMVTSTSRIPVRRTEGGGDGRRLRRRRRRVVLGGLEMAATEEEEERARRKSRCWVGLGWVAGDGLVLGSYFQAQYHLFFQPYRLCDFCIRNGFYFVQRADMAKLVKRSYLLLDEE